MIPLFFIVVNLLYSFVQNQCLIPDKSSLLLCVECEPLYYFDFSVDYKGGGEPFSIDLCMTRNPDFMDQEIFISPFREQALPGDGSAENPFTNMLEAFMAGWKAVNSYISSSLTFYLLGNGLEGEKEEATFFMFKNNINQDFQFLFRSLNSDIKIKPLYCETGRNVINCIRDINLKPKIYWRTESLYFFVLKSLTLENLILDGSEIRLEAYINETNRNKRICSDELLENWFNPSETSDSLSNLCFLRERMIESRPQTYGIFTIENLIGEGAEGTVPQLYLSSVNLQNFVPSGQGYYSVGTMIRTQIVPYNIIITDCKIMRNFFPEGLISGNLTPPEYYNLLRAEYYTIYKPEIVYLIFENEFEMSNSVYIDDNYYKIDDLNKNYYISHSKLAYFPTSCYIKIVNNVFKNNTFPVNMEVFLINYELKIEENPGYKDIYITDNIFHNNSYTGMINILNQRKSVNFKRNNFSFNRNFGLDVVLVSYISSVIIEGCYIEGNIFYSKQFLKLQLGNLLITGTIVQNISFQNTQSAQRGNLLVQQGNPFFYLINVIEGKEFDIFSKGVPLIEPEISFFTEIYVNIEDSSFTDFNMSLISNEKILKTFTITQSSFTNIFNDGNDFIIFPSEYLVKCLSSTFMNINVNYLFRFEFGRHFILEACAFSNIIGMIVKTKVMSHDISPEIQILSCKFSNFTVVAHTIFMEAFQTSSAVKVLFRESSVSLIRGSKLDYFLKANVESGEINELTVSSLVNLNFISLTSTSTWSLVNLITISSFYFEQAGTQSSFLLEILEFSKVIIMDSKFLGSDLMSLQKNWIWLRSTFGSVNISRSIFYSLSALSGGALFISLPYVKSLYISENKFFNNKGNTIGGDLNIDITNKMDEASFFSVETRVLASQIGFGILNNFFVNSQGNEGGSITLLEGAQMVIYANSFANITSVVGGALLFKAKTMGLIYKCNFTNIYSNFSGGVLSMTEALLVFEYSEVNQVNAAFGGFVSLDNSVIRIYSSKFSFCNADKGGAIYALSSDIKILNSLFHSAIAHISGGGLYLSKASLFMRKTNINMCDAGVQGSVLYSELSNNFTVKVLTMQSNNVNDGGIYLYGEGNTIHQFEDIICEKHQSAKNGACFSIVDAEVEIARLIMRGNNVNNGLLYIYSSVFKRTVSIEFSQSYGNSIRESGIHIFNSIMNIRSMTINITNYVATRKISFIIINSKSVFLADYLVFWNSIQRGYFIESTNSNISVINSNLDLGAISSGIKAVSSLWVELSWTVILNGFQIEEDGGGGLTLVDVENAFLKRVKVVDSKGTSGGAIASSSSEVIVDESIFARNNGNADDGYCLKVVGTGGRSITLKSVNFFDPKGGIIYFNNMGNVVLENCYFLETYKLNKTYSKGILIMEARSLFIHRSTFRSLSFAFPILITSSDRTTNNIVAISYCSFNNSLALESGGTLYINGTVVATVDQSNFFNNTSKAHGGAIFCHCSVLGKCSLLIKSSVFAYNFAHGLGSSVKAENLFPEFYNISEYSNIASHGSPFLVLFPTRILIFKISAQANQAFLESLSSVKNLLELNRTSLTELVPGKETNLVAVITDELGNFMGNSEDMSILKLNFAKERNGSKFKLENEEAILVNGSAVFPKLKVFASPGESYELLISFKNSFKKYNFSNDYTIQLRNCIRGELQSGLVCKPCSKNFYSLDIYQNFTDKLCSLCPTNAKCPGGNIILPNKDYWRKSENQSKIVKCRITDACLEVEEPKGGLNYEDFKYTGRCNEFYHGNLCNNCIEGYGKNGNGECVKCSNSYYTYIRYSLFLLFSILMILFQAHGALSFLEEKSKDRSFWKIIVDHISYISIISRFHIEWSDLVKNFFLVNEQFITTTPVEIFTFDCFLPPVSGDNDVFILNIVMVSISPFMYTISTLIFLYFLKVLFIGLHKAISLFYKKMKKINILDSKFSHNAMAVTLVLHYNFYPKLIMNAFSLLQCISIDSTGSVYLEANPDMECWQPLHYYYVYSIAIPNLLIWGITTPVFLLGLTVYLFKNRNKVEENSSKIKLLNYLTLDYHESIYYWEILTYFSKFLIISATVGTNLLKQESQGAILIFSFLILFLLQEIFQPFKNEITNRYKGYSLLISICTTGFSIMASNNEITHSQQQAYLWSLVIINLLFFIGWFFYKFRDFVLQVKEYFFTLKQVLRKKTKSKSAVM